MIETQNMKLSAPTKTEVEVGRRLAHDEDLAELTRSMGVSALAVGRVRDSLPDTSFGD